MYINLKSPFVQIFSPKRGKNVLIILIGIISLIGFVPVFGFFGGRDNSSILPSLEDSLLVVQGNSLMSVSSPVGSGNGVKQQISVIATAYSSTINQTDDDPFVTASGALVGDGIIANNYLPFGTKIRIPEIYGNKIFIVKDRMHWRKSDYQIDIWMPSYLEARNFGFKKTYIEILEG